MLLFLALTAALAAAPDPEDDHELLPKRRETADQIREGWTPTPEGYRSEVRDWRHGGSRVGALVETPAGASYTAYAWGISASGEPGPRVLMRETFANAQLRVWVADLGADYPSAQVELVGALPEAIGWELRVPANEPRRPVSTVPPPSSALTQSLRDLGVISRDSWGARATSCSSTEDDWYRMAIHHTAGNTTYGGTVQGAVQALQAYAMDSGEYCDIPYQFLVGDDGSLWEGRELTYYSGATGGGNNDGNIAVSFLGCFHPNSCPSGAGDEATDAMFAWSRLLVQTLAAEHGFTSDEDTVRGHQDWPGNQTACPGDYVLERMDEIRSPTARFQASFVAQSFPLSADALVLAPGEERSGWIELTNVGTDAWSPNLSWLAPTPRDAASGVQGADWASPTRVATVSGTVAPGQTARFSFSVRGPADGEEHVQTFALVQDGLTWFADRPYGGGPEDSLLAVRVRGEAGAVDSDDTGPNHTQDPGGVRPGDAKRLVDVGTCSSAPSPASLATLLLLLISRFIWRGLGAHRL